MADNYSDDAPTREEVDAWTGTAVLEFGVDWCPHCQAAQDPIAQALAAFPQIKRVKVADGKGRPLGRSFAVKLWPTLVFLRDGSEAATLVRPQDLAAIEQALELIAPTA